MKRPRLSWLLLALASLALIVAACGDASASNDGDERDDDAMERPGAGAPEGGVEPGEPGDAVTDPAQPRDRDTDTGSGTDGPDTPVTDDPGSGRTPADPGEVKPDFGDLPTERELAPIDELELLVRESYPPQYALNVVSGLPSGCASYEETEVVRDGNTIKVVIWNRVISDPEAVCTMVYGLHQQTVELGTDFESGEEYTVLVNDQELTFTAQ